MAGTSHAAARAATLAALVVPAAALAATLFTAGIIAKLGLRYAISEAGSPELPRLFLTLSSFATTLLMVRFMLVMDSREAAGPALTVPWLGLAGNGLGPAGSGAYAGRRAVDRRDVPARSCDIVIECPVW